MSGLEDINMFAANPQQLGGKLTQSRKFGVPGEDKSYSFLKS